MWDEEQERIDAQAAQEALVSNLEKQQKRLEAAEQTIAKLVKAAEVMIDGYGKPLPNFGECFGGEKRLFEITRAIRLQQAVAEAKQFLEK